MPELAQELLALVTDIIVESGDHETLAKLALVNRQLLNLVRERRSSEIVIGGPAFHAKPQKLLGYLQRLQSLIRADPTFAECVITLTLSHDTDVETDWDYGTMGWLAWTEVTEAVSQVLLQLPSLRSLTVTTYTPDAFTDWANVPPDLQDALFHCFSLSSLEELVLERVVNMEITPLIDCPSLTNLSLTGITLSAEDLEPVGEAEPMDVDDAEDGGAGNWGHLLTLEVGDCGTALGKLLEGLERDDARLSISKLKTLTVHAAMFDNTMKQAMKRLVQQAGNSVEELRIRIPVSCNRDVKELKVLESFMELRQFPQLTSVEVEVALSWCDGPQHEWHALRLPRSLEPIQTIIHAIRFWAAGRLETVRLSFSIDPYPVRTWSRMYGANPITTSDIAKSIITSDLWATLESEFGSPSHRGGVDVEVAIGTPLMEDLQEAVKEIELLKRDLMVEGVYRQMPNLTKTGIVSVYCIADD